VGFSVFLFNLKEYSEWGVGGIWHSSTQYSARHTEDERPSREGRASFAEPLCAIGSYFLDVPVHEGENEWASKQRK